MKKYLFLVAISFLWLSCSDETTAPNNEASITVTTQMTSSGVSTITRADKDHISASSVDSLKIHRIRILVKELKLHQDKTSDTDGDRKVKTGPLLFTVDSTKTLSLTSGNVPAGTYDKIKFEFHRFSSSEISNYINDPTYKDFVTDERSTFIIEGVVFAQGVKNNFTYKSDATANLSLNFPSTVTLNGGTSHTIVLQADPSLIFLKGKEILDPRDERNENDIDNAIKSAIKAIKK